MFKFISVLLILAAAFPALAANYARREGQCTLSGYQEDLSNPRTSLPYKIESKMRLTFIAENGQVVKKQFDGWIQDPKATPLDSRLLARMNAWSFYTNTGGMEIWLYQMQPNDWLSLLRSMGATLDSRDPYTFGDILWFNSTGITYQQPFSPLMDAKFTFVLTDVRHSSFEMQIHLPPEVKDGLSFHLKGDCSFQSVP